jgi:hypothetical protein
MAKAALAAPGQVCQSDPGRNHTIFQSKSGASSPVIVKAPRYMVEMIPLETTAYTSFLRASLLRAQTSKFSHECRCHGGDYKALAILTIRRVKLLT